MNLQEIFVRKHLCIPKMSTFLEKRAEEAVDHEINFLTSYWRSMDIPLCTCNISIYNGLLIIIVK